MTSIRIRNNTKIAAQFFIAPILFVAFSLPSSGAFGGVKPLDGPDPDLLTPVESSRRMPDLLPLRFTNRARCALDSKTPARSMFGMIDSYDAGKLGHSLALATKKDPDVTSKKSMAAFRLTV